MTIVVYGHERCPMVLRVRTLLSWSRIPHTYINIHKDEHGAQRVRAINRGNESVPTLVFADGSTLTEPSSRQLAAKLTHFGYPVRRFAFFASRAPLFVTFIGGGMTGALLGAGTGFTAVGLVLRVVAGVIGNFFLIRRVGA